MIKPNTDSSGLTAFVSRNWIPLVILGLGLWVALDSLRVPRYDTPFEVYRFAELPVQEGGRIKPVDTVARNALLIMRHREYVEWEETGADGVTEVMHLEAVPWLMRLAFRPPEADRLPVFRIDNDQVLGLFGFRREDGFDQKYFSFDQLRPHFEVLQQQAASVNPDSQLRTPYERQLLKLRQAVSLYFDLSRSFTPGSNLDTLRQEYGAFLGVIGPGAQAITRKMRGEEYDQQAHDRMVAFGERYVTLSESAALAIAPPSPEAVETGSNDWRNLGEILLAAMGTGEIHPVALGYASLAEAYRSQDAEGFNAALDDLSGWYQDREIVRQSPAGLETWFNAADLFGTSMALYVMTLVVAIFSWLVFPRRLATASLALLVAALLVHTLGLILRMYISGRPPVTNLYSSAVFVGWGTVLLAGLVEIFFRQGLASAAAAAIGFSTLLIADRLALQGDTLELMRAVLDSNFWLATHVVVISLGYSAQFLAGFLGIIFVLRGLLTPSLTARAARTVYGMTYGVTCFALLFSFVGTMLGGIWADQSWGRFWGWDPKENGALMIVIWGALMLHARWGGLVRERGFAQLAIGGNIITAWSWFGTNMLGVGLHSYGFMDSAFVALIAFVSSQLILIAAAWVPRGRWLSAGSLGWRGEEVVPEGDLKKTPPEPALR